MNLKAALLATATAGAFLLVAACGGDGAGGDTSQSQVGNASGSAQPQTGSGAGSISGTGGGSTNGSGGGSTSGNSASTPSAPSAPSAQYVVIDLGSGAGLGIG